MLISHEALLRNGAVRIPVQLATIGTWLYFIPCGSDPPPPAVRRSTAARVTSSRGGSRSRLSLGHTGRRRRTAATSRADEFDQQVGRARRHADEMHHQHAVVLQQ